MTDRPIRPRGRPPMFVMSQSVDASPEEIADVFMRSKPQGVAAPQEVPRAHALGS